MRQSTTGGPWETLPTSLIFIVKDPCEQSIGDQFAHVVKSSAHVQFLKDVQSKNVFRFFALQTSILTNSFAKDLKASVGKLLETRILGCTSQTKHINLEGRKPRKCVSVKHFHTIILRLLASYWKWKSFKFFFLCYKNVNRRRGQVNVYLRVLRRMPLWCEDFQDSEGIADEGIAHFLRTSPSYV